jgi:hypothetical protein
MTTSYETIQDPEPTIDDIPARTGKMTLQMYLNCQEDVFRGVTGQVQALAEQWAERQ